MQQNATLACILGRTLYRLITLMSRIRMQQLPKADRPREKLLRTGVASLSDFELLEVMIGNGSGATDVSLIARNILQLFLHHGGRLNLEQLTGIKGVNDAHACKVLASLEIARRYLVRDSQPLNDLTEVVARLSSIREKQQEYFMCLSLDGGQRLIAMRTITIGTLNTTIAHPREVFADAISDRAASIIIAHNHPSGNAQPSDKDITLTQQLAAAGQLLGISLNDHLIVAKNEFFSFRQHHLL